MVKLRIILYAVLSIVFQIALGYLTGQGQGGIGMLTFMILVEIDPKFSFSYLLQEKTKRPKT